MMPSNSNGSYSEAAGADLLLLSPPITARYGHSRSGVFASHSNVGIFAGASRCG